eukprot:4274-Heterococcus_DN1.PRE.1
MRTRACCARQQHTTGNASTNRANTSYLQAASGQGAFASCKEQHEHSSYALESNHLVVREMQMLNHAAHLGISMWGLITSSAQAAFS